jgi:hypothetical protein
MDMYPYIRVDMRLHSCPNARIVYNWNLTEA